MRFHAKRAVAYFVVSMTIFVVFIQVLEEDDFANHGNRVRHNKVGKRIVTTTSAITHSRPRSALVDVHNSTNLLEYFFSNVENASYLPLWPNPSKPWDDRIVAQIKFLPRGYVRTPPLNPKYIYVPGGLGDTPLGTSIFIKDRCRVTSCSLTTDRSFALKADARLLQSDAYLDPYDTKPHNQIWILWILESPCNTYNYSSLKNYVNWTATYRLDSTLVTPYEKFTPFTNSSALHSLPISKNYAQGKTKMVAWFVSNCGSHNKRWEYAKELQQYIELDIYGACGQMQCDRQDKEKCNAMLRRDYKFYLSFENSNCKYYITEKFFWNALWNDVVPVVMGARKIDYLHTSPPHSFIHVEDYRSPKELAQYLHHLDKNDDLYNEYFRWKTTGEFIDTKFWCRLCSILHAVDNGGVSSWYNSVEQWWRQPGVCTPVFWNNATVD